MWQHCQSFSLSRNQKQHDSSSCRRSFNENRRGRRNKNGLIRWAPSIIIFLTYLVNINSFQRNYDLESKKNGRNWILDIKKFLVSPFGCVVRTTQNNNKIVVKLLWKYFRVKKFESFLCLREVITDLFVVY